MPRLVRAVARTAVIAGTATAVSNRVSRRQAGRWAAQEQQAPIEEQPPQQPVYAQPAYAQPAAPNPVDVQADKVTMLKELAELRKQGVLTESEFVAQKQAILAR